MYAFIGETIKLNQKDFDKFERLFPDLDLNFELTLIDMALTEENPKNWYMALLYKLRYRNDRVKENKRKERTTRDRPLIEDLTDRSWAG